jgi:hypothetical protein
VRSRIRPARRGSKVHLFLAIRMLVDVQRGSLLARKQQRVLSERSNDWKTTQRYRFMSVAVVDGGEVRWLKFSQSRLVEV